MKDILNMTEQQLDAECAKFMGLYDDPAITYVIPEYSKSLDLMHKVEEKIKQKGYEDMYAGILSNIIGDCTEPRQFDLIHASPVDKLKALLTVLDEEKRTAETHELVHLRL